MDYREKCKVVDILYPIEKILNIKNLNKNKVVKKRELSEYLDDNWILGKFFG